MSVVGGTAVRLDRHALVTVRPAGRPLATPGTACVFAGTQAVSGSLVIGPAVLFLPWWTIAALLAPTVLDLTGVALRANRIGRGTGPRAAQQAAGGDAVWLVELYAAHPPGQGHGGRLVDQLIVHDPDDVRLMTAAATPSLAAHYRSRYGFSSWDLTRALLLERPPAGSPPPGPVVDVPVPQQHEPGQ